MKVERLDYAKAGKAIRLDNGFLRLPITATRTGIFVYRDKAGKEWRELRPASEVFDEASIDSLRGVTFTNDHPKEMVNRKNAKLVVCGHVSDIVEFDAKYLKTSVTVTDDDAIAAIERKDKREVSCGYHSDLEKTPGIFQGQPYDAIQRNIRYNHVALVKKGRAGQDVKVHMDSDDSDEELLHFDSFIEIDEPGDRVDHNDPIIPEVSMKTILINGVSVQVEDAGFDTLVNKIKKDEADLIAATAKAEEALKSNTQIQAKFDSATEELKAANLKLDDKAAFQLAVTNRIKLETFAAKKLDGDLASMTDDEIIIKLIQKNQKEFKADGKDSVYLGARLDHMMDNDKPAAGGAATKLVDALGDKARKDSDSPAKTSAEIRRERQDAQTNAWKTPIGHTSKK